MSRAKLETYNEHITIRSTNMPTFICSVRKGIVSPTGLAFRFEHRKWNRGRNRLPKLVQTIAPSVPFPVFKSEGEPCTASCCFTWVTKTWDCEFFIRSHDSSSGTWEWESAKWIPLAKGHCRKINQATGDFPFSALAFESYYPWWK